MIGDGLHDRQGQGLRHRPADRRRRQRHRREASSPLRRPGSGFQTVTHAACTTTTDILLGYVYTDEAIQNSADVPDRRHRVRLREEPADDHVGSGDVPRRRPDRRPRHRPVSWSATSAARRTWTTSPAPGILERRPGRRLVRRRPGAVHRRRGQVGPAGLRLGRAVHLRERGRRLGKPVTYQYINDVGWEQLRRVDRHEAGEHRPSTPTASRSWCR